MRPHAPTPHIPFGRGRMWRCDDRLSGDGGSSGPPLALLPGVQETLRVERLLDARVQLVRVGAPLALELAALQPPDAVLAADRAAEADREVEQLVARVVRALRLVRVVVRE